MKRGYTIMMLLLAILMAGCGRDEDAVDSYLGFDIPKAVLDQYLEKAVTDLNMPGMAIAFINDGEVVHHRTIGYANLEQQIPVDAQTIFEAASMSKSVFAYFVMKYVDAGRLDLDQPLYTYLPYPDIADDERYKQITARMVLSHRSGFPNWRTDYPDNKLFIQFDPGTDYSYSGEGYQYLAMVLKEIEGTDWAGLEARFQELVAQPLGMEHTVFIQDAYSMAHKAEPYDEKGVWINPERDVDSLYRYQFRAPASIHSEPLDFSKWMMGLMNREGLSEASFEELFKVHSYVNEFNSIKVDYSLGFFRPRLPLTNIYMHGGNNFGFTSSFTLDPDKKWGFVLFTNSEYGERFGSELTLWLLAGPDLTPVYGIVGMLVILFVALVIFGVRFFVGRRKKG